MACETSELKIAPVSFAGSEKIHLSFQGIRYPLFSAGNTVKFKCTLVHDLSELLAPPTKHCAGMYDLGTIWSTKWVCGGNTPGRKKEEALLKKHEKHTFDMGVIQRVLYMG